MPVLVHALPFLVAPRPGAPMKKKRKLVTNRNNNINIAQMIEKYLIVIMWFEEKTLIGLKCYAIARRNKVFILSNEKGRAAFFRAYLIDVRDEFTLSRHVDFLIVCSHLALDRKEENLQISLLCKPEKTTTTLLIRKYSILWLQLNMQHKFLVFHYPSFLLLTWGVSPQSYRS